MVICSSLSSSTHFPVSLHPAVNQGLKAHIYYRWKFNVCCTCLWLHLCVCTSIPSNHFFPPVESPPSIFFSFGANGWLCGSAIVSPFFWPSLWAHLSLPDADTPPDRCVLILNFTLCNRIKPPYAHQGRGTAGIFKFESKERKRSRRDMHTEKVSTGVSLIRKPTYAAFKIHSLPISNLSRHNHDWMNWNLQLMHLYSASMSSLSFMHVLVLAAQTVGTHKHRRRDVEMLERKINDLENKWKTPMEINK